MDAIVELATLASVLLMIIRYLYIGNLVDEMTLLRRETVADRMNDHS